MKIITLLVLLCAFTLTAQAAPAAPTVPAGGTKVAIVDVQRAIRETSDGKKAEATLRKEMEDMQKKVQADGKKIQEAMEDLRKQAMVMDEKTRRGKEEAIQAQIMKLRESEAKNQQKFQERDQEISGPIVKRIREVVAQISKEKGYTLVIDGGNVIYAQDQDDITQEVVKRYDSKK
jgi:outer membrane protein